MGCTIVVPMEIMMTVVATLICEIDLRPAMRSRIMPISTSKTDFHIQYTYIPFYSSMRFVS
ncbi:hypothetical protein J2Z28_000263 [Paenibacillus xylanexedens]|uniref:Uncharacterized protein n=1 Tax=Paenibacillus xylanexedens TaxID=528191 RepID=A0ABS4RL87_PAEXY|nr:hypothetical protein [Paenibacillus xylanexedens]